MAVCDFCTDLWNLGGTCIKNHMDGLDLPNCPKATSEAKKKAIDKAIKMIKPPGGREKPRHQDHAYFKLPLSTPVVGVWLAV